MINHINFYCLIFLFNLISLIPRLKLTHKNYFQIPVYLKIKTKLLIIEYNVVKTFDFHLINKKTKTKKSNKKNRQKNKANVHF